MEDLKRLYNYLKKSPKKILFLTTSNRWSGEKDLPKSSLLAQKLHERLPNSTIIDVSDLVIHSCEGNVSTRNGNNCGVKEAMLNSNNPNKFIRCWAAINNKDDEMYKVANAIYDADIIIFFGSIRWGKMNAVYTRLVERLTWLENRHTTLGEDNLLKNKECGVVAIGHNWNGAEAVKLEKQVLGFFGFKTPDILSFNWQFTQDMYDESQSGYKEDFNKFMVDFNFVETLKESFLIFKEWLKHSK
jgi:multimeric flavodoxin WrbA